MIRSILLLSILLVALNSRAQSVDRKYIDSVSVSISKLDKENVRVQLKQLRNKIEVLDKEDAIPLFEYLLENSVSSFAKMIVCGEYGAYLVTRDIPEKAMEYFTIGLALSEDLNETLDLMWFHVNLANTYIFQNRPDEAMDHLNSAEPLAVDLELVDAITSINYSKGMVYESIEDYNSATERYLKAWDNLNTVDDHPEKGFYLYVLVDYFKRIGEITQQAKFTEILAAYYQKRQPETPFTHLPMNHIFDTAATEANILRYRDVIRVSDSLGALNALLYSSLSLSDIYLKSNLTEDAIDLLLPIIKSLDTTDRDQQKMALYGKLSSLYETSSDYKNALLYKNLEAELRDTLVSEKTKKNVAELEVKYDLQTKDRKLEQQAASQKLLYWILGSVFVILGIISFFFVKNRKKNQKLARQKKLLEATVDEKNVLLKETHHRVKNSFQIVSSLLYLQSENMEDTEAQRAIKEAQNRVKSMVLIHQKLYNKDQLVGIDTREYFDDLTKEIFESHQDDGNKVDYKLNVESMMLDIESITPIGLILNELITNVLKHAFDSLDSERQLDIDFQKDGDELVLTVSDNGKGMPEEVLESSFGIKLMKALAKKLKATLQFENAPVKGTVATLNVSRYNLLS
ncbi:MAG: sensor histidine kinase [Bacteroidia bacterium]|nr:sensor histidine kinase [Bacteroidia bacterium]MBT8277155.1 sensor histidine kinase [Bacteroidia bacterium]NNF30800.1 sensor histidine kinase [Flavobacteriaceae bacterium]NNJ82934.1 sensor histidine kinase [Flavobacteriaceae bacterium]NNK55608.1 sensor histidine kinase [Flavobacteriaceae bacterium]